MECLNSYYLYGWRHGLSGRTLASKFKALSSNPNITKPGEELLLIKELTYSETMLMNPGALWTPVSIPLQSPLNSEETCL
jgi:hypothetical protein